ncbi:ATP-binding cassette domain-containing protein [Alicyclobacillus dauci]|uniref:ATP-binding cassette domain-containing protein n=1 Tax=Alicyclobacillus dauci TaxID=1475485 RepID=A0ABY6Z345_9BACL|nr:ATP-binding cassette domain-containing protein [Alicyclobacillus dauci]WAH36626.1 ATP-binding cassette domain-containing protein [Alicyclobacillus dauci]
MSLCLREISVSDGQTNRLGGVTAEVPAGAFLAVVGRNGAGKSTLLDVVAGMVPPSTGTISVSGGDPFPRIGYLFQNAELSLFAGTVAEEFAVTWETSVSSVRSRLTEVTNLLTSVGLNNISLGDTPAAWSTGLQRRFALALMLARKPEFLILDEPTAGLDRASQALLVNQLQTLHDEGKTIVVTTHDLDTILPHATHVWLLDGGKLVFSGSPAELYASPSCLETHGVGLPPSLRLQIALMRAGLLDGPSLRSAQQLASDIRGAGAGGEAAGRIDLPGEDTYGFAESSVANPHPPTTRVMDARFRWLSITLMTIALATVHHSGGIMTGLVLTCVLLIWLRAKFRTIARWTVPWATFAALTALIAGIHVGAPFHRNAPYGFDATMAARSIISIIPYWCFLQLGQLLVTQSTSLQVQGMIDGLGRACRIPHRIRHTVAITAGMVFRFIPAIGAMYQQQLRAYRARTQPKGHSAASFISVTRVLAPLIIRLIHYGEATTDALTARDILNSQIHYEGLYQTTVSAREWILFGMTLAFSLVIWLSGRFLF